MPRGQYDRSQSRALRVVEANIQASEIDQTPEDELAGGFTKEELKDEIVRFRKLYKDQSDSNRMLLSEVAIKNSEIKLLEDRAALYERLLDKWTQE